MTVALTLQRTTITLGTETCPTASLTNQCTARPPTAASKSSQWDAAATREKPRGESHPSYQLWPIRPKVTARGHFHLQAPVLRKWTCLNQGKTVGNSVILNGFILWVYKSATTIKDTLGIKMT